MQVFAVCVKNDKDKYYQLKIEDIPILKYFKDIFLEEGLELPSKRDIEFTIDLIPGVILASKVPYRMNITHRT